MDTYTISLMTPGRIKIVRGSTKLYIAALFLHNVPRQLHKVYRRAEDAQKYAIRTLAKWRILHG